MSAEVVLSMVDHLTGPAKYASNSARALFKDLSKLSKIQFGGGKIVQQVNAIAKSA